MIQGVKTKLNPIPSSKGSRLFKRLRFGMYATLKPRNGTPIPTPLYLFNPPYLTLCRRDGGGPKIFDSKYFSDSNFFGPTIFLDPKYFWTQNIFGRKIFLDPKFFYPKFFDPKIIWNMNFFQLNNILEPNYF